MSPATYLAALAVVSLWGFNFVALKVGVTTVPPLFFTALRFAAAGLVLAPLLLRRRVSLRGAFALSVVLGLLHFGVLSVGVHGVDAATAAIAIQLQVPFSALLAGIFFGDRLGWRRGLGMALAFGGVALLVGEPTLPQPLPLLLVIGAAFAWAAAQVVVKRLGPVDPLALNGAMALLAAPQLLVLSLLLEQGQIDSLVQPLWPGWAAMAYVVVGSSLIAYSLWYRLISTHDINRIVPFTLLAPMIGVLSGVLVLDEPFTWQKAVGGALTILGVAVVQIRSLRKRAEGRKTRSQA